MWGSGGVDKGSVSGPHGFFMGFPLFIGRQLRLSLGGEALPSQLMTEQRLVTLSGGRPAFCIPQGLPGSCLASTSGPREEGH